MQMLFNSTITAISKSASLIVDYSFVMLSPLRFRVGVRLYIFVVLLLLKVHRLDCFGLTWLDQ